MKVDLLGGSYQQKYKELNSQRSINWYPVVSSQEEKSKNQMALFPTPGLTLYTEIPGRYSRGIYTTRTHTFPSRCFAVVDTTLYEIINGGYVSRGSLPAIGIGGGKVYLVENANDQLGIFNYSGGYVFNMDTNTLTQITTIQYPSQITYADFLDGYGVFVSSGSVYYTLANDFLSGTNTAGWFATNVFSPTFKPSPTIAAIALREQIYCFTSTQLEIYINDGTSPYSRLPRSTVFIGLAARESIACTQNGFYFLGRLKTGETAVYFFDSYYTAKENTPTSIVWNLNNFNGFVDDAYAYIENTKDGHQFYFLTIPALKTTYVLDLNTNMWHERQSKQPANDSNGDNVYREFRGRHYTNFNGLNLWQDLYSGKVFIEDFKNQMEYTHPIIRTRISETINQEYQNIAIHSLELDMNTGYGTTTGQGSSPNLMISYSKDGGYSYTDPRQMHIGTLGNHITRARLRKLGTARNWTFKITLSDPVDVMLNNAIVHGTVSDN